MCLRVAPIVFGGVVVLAGASCGEDDIAEGAPDAALDGAPGPDGATAVDARPSDASPADGDTRDAQSPEGPFAIQWELGPDLPRGFQDGPLVDLGGLLVTAGGFTGSGPVTDVPDKPTKYPAGFWADGFSLLPGATAWQSVPAWSDLPRQGLAGAAIGDTMYVWGGFDYQDGKVVSRPFGARWKRGAPAWEKLPDFPYPVHGASMVAIGNRLYVLGGAYADGTAPDRTRVRLAGGRAGVGARLWTLDTTQIGLGFRELSPLPGTPRYLSGVAAVGDKIYALGGSTGVDNTRATTCKALDSWVYDTPTDTWSRLPDFPRASASFPGGNIAYAQRYVFLIGGHTFPCIETPDSAASLVGTAIDDTRAALASIFPTYGIDSDVMVFDTKTSTYAQTTSLPITNNIPSTTLVGDTLHMVGGETGGAAVYGYPYLGGRYFGNRPDLYLRGKIVPAAQGESALFQPAIYKPLKDQNFGAARKVDVAGVCIDRNGPVAVALGSVAVTTPCRGSHYEASVVHAGGAGNVELAIRQATSATYQHRVNLRFE